MEEYREVKDRLNKLLSPYFLEKKDTPVQLNEITVRGGAQGKINVNHRKTKCDFSKIQKYKEEAEKLYQALEEALSNKLAKLKLQQNQNNKVDELIDGNSVSRRLI